MITSTLETPIPITTTRILSAFEIIDIRLFLHSKAVFIVNLLDEKNDVIEVKTYTLEGADYENWGSDDSYVIYYVTKKILEHN